MSGTDLNQDERDSVLQEALVELTTAIESLSLLRRQLRTVRRKVHQAISRDAKPIIDHQAFRRFREADWSIEELELGVRVHHTLESAGITNILQLAAMSEESVAAIRYLGPKNVVRLKVVLGTLGLRLGMTPEELQDFQKEKWREDAKRS